MKSVEVKNLSKDFGSFKAVDNISFDVFHKEIFGFLGANGAGKSTTIRILCGIYTRYLGSARIHGLDIKDNIRKLKQQTGYMSQKFSLYDDLTVIENINFFGGIHKLDNDKLKKRTKEILNMAELNGKENIITRNLSGGWKQRLALGCSMIHEPSILFLDEPTAGVDPQARRHFWDIIHQLRESGVTIFVTSHYMDEVEQCDRIALMHRGKIAALNTPQLLKEKMIPGNVYLLYLQSYEDISSFLMQSEYIYRVDPSGAGYHIIIDKTLTDRQSYGLVMNMLKDKNILVDHFTKIETTLEDVFVYLIGKLENEYDKKN